MSIGLVHSPRPASARWLVLALLMLTLIVPVVTVSAAPLGGTLTGKVTMKTAGASLPSAPVTVDLLFYNPGFFRSNDEAVDFKETTTAPDGSFTFGGLDTSPGGVYRLVARYKGVTFEPPPRDFTDESGATQKTVAVRFANNTTTASVDVPIAEPVVVAPGAGFTITAHSVVINEVRPQFYSVVEAYQFQNDSDHALAGSLKPDGSVDAGVPVVFSLPPNATGITTNRTDLLATGDLAGQKLTLKTAIAPGSSDVTCTYSLQGDMAGVAYNRTLDYPANKFEVLISDTNQPVDPGPGLKLDTPIQPGQASMPFKRLNTANATAGQQIAIRIAPSPPAPTGATTPATNNGNIFDRLRSGISSPALLALAALCLILMVVILRLPTRPEPAKPGATATTATTTKTTRGKTDSAPTETVTTSRGRRGYRACPHKGDNGSQARESGPASRRSGRCGRSGDRGGEPGGRLTPDPFSKREGESAVATPGRIGNLAIFKKHTSLPALGRGRGLGRLARKGDHEWQQRTRPRAHASRRIRCARSWSGCSRASVYPRATRRPPWTC